MREEGAHSICPHTCPVLNGFKSYQAMDWYDQMEANSPARINAELNEKEFLEGLQLTEYFFKRHVFGVYNKPIPSPRQRLFERVEILQSKKEAAK